MSNIYIQEPPTEGKVLVTTSAGDFDIELWSKEAPKACRNFVQLCLEGYYNGTIFHRVIPGFIVQGGDPDGTGKGGESIYGKTFKDEFHSRLRFVRRGLVAMANSAPNDNGSQFFFTLGTCPELQNKHTIFGKVAGDTIYNLPRFEEGSIGKDERPEYPHKIIKTEILNNPFEDIVPRKTDSVIENEIQDLPNKKKDKGTKNFKLLSFGDEAEEDESDFVEKKKKDKSGNSAHDIARDPTLSSKIPTIEKTPLSPKPKKILQNIQESVISSKDEIITEQSIGKTDKNNSRSNIRAEIRKLKQELRNKNTGKPTETEIEMEEEVAPPKKDLEPVNETMKNYLEEKEQYVENKKKLLLKGASRESQTLALLKRFIDKPVEEENEDESWLNHPLSFETADPVVAKDASTKDDNWYDITDPRNSLNKRRREETKSSSKSQKKKY